MIAGRPSEFARRRFIELMAAVGGGVLAGATIGTPSATAVPGSAGHVPGSYIAFQRGTGRFPLVATGKATPLVVNASDYPGVVRAVNDLSADLQRVSGVQPSVVTDHIPAGDVVVIIGTIGHSPLVDELVAAGKLDVSGIVGQWETSLEQVVENPMPGVRQAFVIAGSDQRGTIFGIYDVSRAIGVSPWYWWDDVPAPHHDELYVLPGRHTQGTPAVRYRGFFINDENPNLGGWGPEYFGPGLAPGHPSGFNAKFYAKIFETMLRLKANYLWPAVWGRAFAEDDPQNHATATEYGIIMGTSHEAPMLRGIEEWNRHAVAAVRDANGNIITPGHDPYGGTGEWSFRYNAPALKAYWREGIQRMVDQHIEGVVTVGMRGNGDTALGDGNGIELMTEIIAAERQIIADVTGQDPATVPQVWTLYKEVQRYWAEGLRPPDDVIAVFTDDNWGNIRKLPDPSLPPRAGGYGLYYHFDYVGGGRSYKWVDSSLIADTWEQLHQAVAYGVTRLWVANVGDMKGNEVPLQFFLDYAWNPVSWSADQLTEWERQYAAQNFGPDRATDIAAVLHTYARLQSRRKPELLNRRITIATGTITYDDQMTPFSLTDYQELDTVTAQWQALAEEADRISSTLPVQYQDAWYELVGYEVKASANLYALRQAEFTNLHYATQGRAATNALAATAAARFANDQAMMTYFNTKVAGGKWHGFMVEPHIDYGDKARYGSDAGWAEPSKNGWAIPDVIFPAVQEITLSNGPELGVAIDGSDSWWPGDPGPAVLPTFSPYQSQPAQYIEVFNRGMAAFDYTIRADVPWLTVTPNLGTVHDQVRCTVHVDWSLAPQGSTTVPITVTGPNGTTVTVTAIVDRPEVPPGGVRGFVEANGYVSIEADHFTRAIEANGVSWQRIPDIGRTGSGMTPFPVTAPSQTPGGSGACLEYQLTLFTTGSVVVWVYLSPRNPVLAGSGIRYAISLDDDTPQVVDIIAATGANDTTMNRQWETNTSENVNRTSTTHTVTTAGVHTLRFWMVDPTVVLQNLIVDTGGLRPSYLGPPESRRY
jgi:hypothetical protein